MRTNPLVRTTHSETEMVELLAGDVVNVAGEINCTVAIAGNRFLEGASQEYLVDTNGNWWPINHCTLQFRPIKSGDPIEFRFNDYRIGWCPAVYGKCTATSDPCAMFRHANPLLRPAKGYEGK